MMAARSLVSRNGRKKHDMTLSLPVRETENSNHDTHWNERKSLANHSSLRRSCFSKRMYSMITLLI